MSDISEKRLAARYGRLESQLQERFAADGADPISRMATAVALLHHKMPHYFWTGFYRVQGDRLVVGPYQGPLACAVLEGSEGVCRACLDRGESIIVPDVHAFPGHVACDARSASELVVPVRDPAGHIQAVLDVDSREKDAFRSVDQTGLEAIAALILRG